MTGISPNDAQSNFSEWLILIGLSDLPTWILSDDFDNFMWLFIYFSLAIYLFWWLMKNINGKININDAITIYATNLRNKDSVKSLDINTQNAEFKPQVIAYDISQNCDIYGFRMHSNRLDLVSRNEVKNHRYFKNSANDIGYSMSDNSKIKYGDVHVSRKDLNKLIKHRLNEK